VAIDETNPGATAEPARVIAEDGSVVGTLPELGDSELLGLHRWMLVVRCMDERMLKLQRAGRVGFVGSMLGQEAQMIGTAAALRPHDWMWSGLREGGAALMRGLPLGEYIAQMYCNSNDTAKGRQMCNHLQHKGSNYPSWSSVIGTQIPNGVGAAYAAKVRGKDEVHGIYFGDGAASSNGFHSGMNFAGVWKVPCVFVLADNGWAISVSSREQTAGDLSRRGLAYGVPTRVVDGNDVLACRAVMEESVERAREGAGPSLLIVKTYRMKGHSSSDDPTVYRDPAEVAEWEARDPIARYERFLAERGLLSPEAASGLKDELIAEIDAEIHVQEAADPMPLRSLVEDVYAEVPRHLRKQFNAFVRVAERLGHARPGDGEFPL
jgi:pyruvate dehydrogenase E1 component alpha subunit/2-oxoisovalerate dehydrogenase E1 component alpha subunit